MCSTNNKKVKLKMMDEEASAMCKEYRCAPMFCGHTVARQRSSLIVHRALWCVDGVRVVRVLRQ